MGGTKDDYDVVKPDIAAGRTVAAGDGTMDAYRRLYDAVIDGDRVSCRVLCPSGDESGWDTQSGL
jgi:hypothetical protein